MPTLEMPRWMSPEISFEVEHQQFVVAPNLFLVSLCATPLGGLRVPGSSRARASACNDPNRRLPGGCQAAGTHFANED